MNEANAAVMCCGVMRGMQPDSSRPRIGAMMSAVATSRTGSLNLGASFIISCTIVSC
jgi:hypothetical protein